ACRLSRNAWRRLPGDRAAGARRPGPDAVRAVRSGDVLTAAPQAGSDRCALGRFGRWADAMRGGEVRLPPNGLEDLPLALEALELVPATVVELDRRPAREIARRGRDEHLARPCPVHDPPGKMDRYAAELA